MKLSVLILNYNVAPFLGLCLQSVFKALEQLDGEVIVVDNNSEDDSCDMVRAKFPQVKLISNTDNYGFSKGNNLGAAEAKGDYMLILNPDTVVPENAFKDMMIFADSCENLGALGCQLIDGRGMYLPESKRHVPKPIVAMKKMLGFDEAYYYNELNKEDNGPCDILVGACMMLKRAVYQEMGGFDETYFMYGEDIDLSYKLLQSGYQNYYQGSVKMVHFKGESTLKDRNYAKRFYGAMEVFYSKYFKSNAFRDLLVNIGIQLAYVTRSKTKSIGPSYSHINVLSESETKFENLFNEPLHYKLELKNLPSDALVIFDTELIAFETIITLMSSNTEAKGNYFRIKPLLGNFILGSDSSSSRGEVKVLNS